MDRQSRNLGLLLVGVAACAVAAAGSAAESRLLLDDFDADVQNRLGGYRNTFAASPSTASAQRITGGVHGAAGRHLQLQGVRAAEGFCGYWIHLFNMKDKAPRYIDVRAYDYLSFWIRGEKGGEALLFKLADKGWIEREDSVPVQPIEELLANGITTQWQEVRIPLHRRGDLDWTALGGVTFEFAKPGEFTVYLDDLALCSLNARPAAVGPAPAAKPTPVSTAASAANPIAAAAHPVETVSANQTRVSLAAPGRAIWVWSTERVLGDVAYRDQLFTVCQAYDVAEIWLQALYTIDRQTAPARCLLRRPDEFAQFVAAAHQRRLAVHALDGLPEFAVRDQHDVPLGLLDAVADFNRQRSREQHFDGVHFDNEPYLLVGWHAPELRRQILSDFLELNWRCQHKARAVGLRFGVDIPFWWHEPAAGETAAVGLVDFQGVAAPASYHCLRMLDNVGIMNYRDQADGADGMIAHGRESLAFASTQGRAQVFLGVETTVEPPRAVWFAFGLPREQFLAKLSGEGAAFAYRSRWHERRLRVLPVANRIHVGIELPEWTAEPPAAAVRAMIDVARLYGGLDAASWSAPAWEAQLAELRANLAQDREWSRLESHPVVDGAGRSRAGFLALSTMLPKITFGDNSLAEFRKETAAAEAYFGQFSAFQGLALHSFESLRGRPFTAPQTR